MRLLIGMCLLGFVVSARAVADDVVIPPIDASSAAVSRFLTSSAAKEATRPDIMEGVRLYHRARVRPPRMRESSIEVAEGWLLQEAKEDFRLVSGSNSISLPQDEPSVVVFVNGKAQDRLMRSQAITDGTAIVARFGGRLWLCRRDPSTGISMRFLGGDNSPPTNGEVKAVPVAEHLKKVMDEVSPRQEWTDFENYRYSFLTCARFGIMPMIFHGDRIPFDGDFVLGRSNGSLGLFSFDKAKKTAEFSPFDEPRLWIVTGTDLNTLAVAGPISRKTSLVAWTGQTVVCVRIASIYSKSILGRALPLCYSSNQ